MGCSSLRPLIRWVLYWRTLWIKFQKTWATFLLTSVTPIINISVSVVNLCWNFKGSETWATHSKNPFQPICIYYSLPAILSWKVGISTEMQNKFTQVVMGFWNGWRRFETPIYLNIINSDPVLYIKNWYQHLYPVILQWCTVENQGFTFFQLCFNPFLRLLPPLCVLYPHIHSPKCSIFCWEINKKIYSRNFYSPQWLKELEQWHVWC